MMNRVPLLQFGSTGFKIFFFFCFFWSNKQTHKQTNTYVHTSIYGYMGAGGGRGARTTR